VAVNHDEWLEPTICCDCGASIWPETERAFACSPESYLCFACAERRGGVFDAAEERWTTAPDVEDIADERRPHP
jgi:hypothetical protein